MKTGGILPLTFLAVITAITIPSLAVAQGMRGGMGPGMMQGDRSQGMMGADSPQHGMDQGPADQGMMQGSMMHGGMNQGQNMTCPSMMGSEMMRGTPRGMMGSRASGGMAGLFGSRVTPMMNLSADDVRGYLGAQLQRLNNKRLKLGNISVDGETIVADVVTVDNSLVQRLKVNRYTGIIEYEN